MSPVKRVDVELGRLANLQARQAGTPPATPDVQKAKRSSRSHRLANGPAFTGVTLTVPIAHCISDNERVMIQRNRRRIVSHPDYRAAKNVIQGIARRAMGEAPPTREPVEWRAVVHFPNNRRDLQNAAKLLCDSCSKIVYADDKQIKRAVWEWGENDPADPRIVITITPRAA